MTPQPLPPSARLTVWGQLEVGVVLVCLATVTGFLGRLWWIFELTSHFRLHLALALGALAILWAIKRRWRLTAVCGVAAAVNAGLVSFLLWPADNPEATASPRLRLVALNVHTANQRSDLVLEFLRRADADVLLLMEVNERWLNALGSLRANYPHVIAESREDNFGIALFSRLPLTNMAVVEFGKAELPSITATIAVGGQGIFLLGTHPLPPGSAENAQLRNEQLRDMAAHVRRQTMPAIVLGDLNCTPWSPYFCELLRESGLKNSSQGRGLFGSWPAWLPCAKISLDHCLVAPSIHVSNKQLGPQVGSDHLPLVIDLQISPRKSEAARL
jgi:endonuclease/exonuclease/phosphatase (EEP) superfamily protein YafD